MKTADGAEDARVTDFTPTIDGCPETSDAWFDDTNPANGIPFARCPDASRAQLDRAVAAARHAFGSWSSLSFANRRNYLQRFGKALSERAEDLAPLLVREQGKPRAAAKEELSRVAVQTARCHRHYHSMERTHRDCRWPNRAVSLYRQYGCTKAIAEHAFDDVEDGGDLPGH